MATGGGFRLRGRRARRVARAVIERAGRRPHLFVWGAVAAFVALDAVPSASLHAPLAAVAALAAATWSHLYARRTWRARSRYLSDLVLELRRRSQRYELAATTDELTGLANAPEFRRRLERALDPDPGNPGAPGAVLVIDINSFKRINDTHGHHVGDNALKRVARILREETRADDVVARLGGDEFAVLLDRGTEAGASRIAQRIEAAAKGQAGAP